MTSHDKALAVAAMALRAADPAAWDVFLAVVRASSDYATNQLIAARPDTLQTSQGRAQQALAFWQLLTDAPRLTEELKQREPNGPGT